MDLSKKKVELASEWINVQLIRYEEQGVGHISNEKNWALKNIQTDRFISIIDTQNIHSANVAEKME